MANNMDPDQTSPQQTHEKLQSLQRVYYVSPLEGLGDILGCFPLASICLSFLTNGPLLGTLNFRNFSFSKPTHPNSFFKFIVFKNHLWNKPHLHIKGANKLRMRFIP